MAMAVPESTLSALLLTVLHRSGWREGTVVLCRGWEEAGGAPEDPGRGKQCIMGRRGGCQRSAGRSELFSI
ncbi:hypothetical protein CesoFtcFv8_005615 [Champsocephalus esox]|uniref:Uncharacterized protein n=1 Tax=Champsocephalus esox TaxID=159716 RepID=A0AAN8H9K1_9TELE|nr:hypothetical protein CesoFtcFv8_005615 [Champsocephalus esox]